jgi:hypothetical protein
MNRTLPASLALLLLGSSLVAQPPSGPLVILDTRIVDVVAGRTRAVAALVIDGDRIAAVHAGAPGTLPDGARRIDGSGLTLVPGLVDLAVQAQPSADLDVDYFYALALAHGVTTMRTVDARLVWAVEQRERVRKGIVVAPRLVTSGPLVDGRGIDPLAPVPMPSLLPMTVVGNTAAANREVTRQAAAGADWIRLGPRVGADLLRAVLPAARTSGLRVSVAPGATSMAQLAQLSVQAVDGLGTPVRSQVEYESLARRNGASPEAAAVLDVAWASLTASEQRGLVQRLVRARVPVVPLLRLGGERVLGTDDEGVAAEMKLAPPRVRAVAERARAVSLDKAARSLADKGWEARRRFVLALAQAGGRLGAGSGAGVAGWPVPGLALQRELQLMEASGLTPVAALQAATVSGAEILGLKGVGQIRPGYRADLVALRADPLEGLAALSGVAFVVRGGERLEPEALLKAAERATRVVK